ncbi:phosphoglycerate kinase [Fodinicurvata sp. EGI_FJ10296]|uniref:phosphoglycerate kinase n=1 Tax=Fodinicurvata sp. EGI_FJ10296 TaxID=3231908 RepID=UPI0034559B86
MSAFKTLDDVDVAGKTVLVRADLNVPMSDGKVSDTTRLDRLAPTLTELADKGAKVVVMSHFGRPKGKRSEKDSLRPVAAALSVSLDGRPVSFAEDCIGAPAASAIEALTPGGVLVLENLRFHAEEEANDVEFARSLSVLGDLYVNDAFSAAHRAHASTEAIARLLPSVAGRLMEQELTALTNALEKPERPVLAVVGGAKISTKLDLLGNMIGKVDMLVLGGGMANTFLHAKGVDVGTSLCESDMADAARDIMARAEKSGCRIILPSDAVVARKLEAGAPNETVAIDAIPSDAMMLDVGPDTIAALTAAVDGVKTVLWNGPLGVFEVEPFGTGTFALARHVAELTEKGRVLSVAGGGDTVAALSRAGVDDRFTYVSSAGGAFLEWLEGKDLPGVAALKTD